MTLTRRIARVLLVVAVGSSCRTTGIEPGPLIVQPGAPGESSRIIAAETAADLPRVQYTRTDIKFMQGMIGHHAQAVEMVALVPSRTSGDDIKKLALRIDVSQADEIRLMQHWLEGRGQQVPVPHALHTDGASLMPGMLTAQEMSRLANARGAEFDRLFLEAMIKHHSGALIMVEKLFSTPGAGQESEIFAFASDVEADQRLEIERMSAMLTELQK
jgi:uncharacterized protein (DUF305 family)